MTQMPAKQEGEDDHSIASADGASFFSIVTAIWNNKDGLELTRQSLAEQSIDDWEWIIVDGASNDGTAELAKSLAGVNVNVISERDRGIYDAMNKGLRAARGRYVIFMNGGDRFFGPETLGRLRAELQKRPVDILFGDGHIDFGILTVKRPAKDPSYIWHGQPAIHQSTVFRRTVHLAEPYSTAYKICGDYDALTRLMSHNPATSKAAIDVSVNSYDPGSTSTKNKMRLIREASQIQRRNLKMAYPKIGVSIARRALASFVAKGLSRLHGFKK